MCIRDSPYALEWKNDHYYLIGYSHKHHGMAHFRVDRLAGIEILEMCIRDSPGEETIWYYAHEQDKVKRLCDDMTELLEKKLARYLNERCV